MLAWHPADIKIHSKTSRHAEMFDIFWPNILELSGSRLPLALENALRPFVMLNLDTRQVLPNIRSNRSFTPFRRREIASGRPAGRAGVKMWPELEQRSTTEMGSLYRLPR